MTRIIDLFAGPGGWSEGLRTLGYRETGIEWDEAACATARAAGHGRVQADVAALDPADFAPCWGVIGSPPCPTFSAAGGGSGRHLTEIIVACLRALSEGRDTRAEARAEAFETLQPVAWEAERAKAKKAGREPDRERADARARRDADMSILVVEPLRWALALRSEWVALEQVPEVLPLWEVMASLLQAHGYSTWTGKLEAERFGVPQTRERAILIAHRSRAVVPPQPTHQRYVPGEPRRHEVTILGEVRPWVSMAEALGWDEGPSPSPSVTGGGGETGGVEVFASKAARARAAAAVRTGNFTAVERDADGERSKAGSVPYERSVDDPAPVVTGNADRWKLRAGTNANDIARPADEPAPTLRFGARSNDVSWVSDAQPNATRRHADEPAPTIKGGHCAAERLWVPTHYDSRYGGFGKDQAPRSVDLPAPTQTSAGLAKGRDVWTQERPAPTVVTTRRSKDGLLVGRQLPEGEGENVGGHGYHDGTKGKGDAVRVTVEEAAILQSFRPDYPWQGSRTKQFEQVGNAVPPMLARAVLSALIDDLTESQEDAA